MSNSKEMAQRFKHKTVRVSEESRGVNHGLDIVMYSSIMTPKALETK
jgi:hypothetical protein